MKIIICCANLATPYLNSTTDVIQVNAEAGEMAKQMKAAAESEGISLTVTSGYMDYKEIEERAMDIISMNGEEYAKANGFLAGYNEHQTGLALDFTDDPTNINNPVAFKDTEGPLKSLKAFERVEVKAGKTAEAVITLDSRNFELFDAATNTVRAKAGKYEVYYGSSSADKDLKKLDVSIEY